jgi:hypothetical protein
MSKQIVNKISENLERVIFRIDEMYDKDKNVYSKIYNQFYNLCEKHSLVEGSIDAENHKWLLSQLKNTPMDNLLDIHNDLNKFLESNKELKINVKL